MRWLRNWLGITSLIDDVNAMRNSLIDLVQTQERTNRVNQEMIQPLLNGVGRIIAKHDAFYAQSELDNPERKAASDKLGDEAIARLKAEDKARRHTLGHLLPGED